MNAIFAETVASFIEVVVAPEICIPPPFPGFGVPAVPFTSLKAIEVPLRFNVPSTTSIPPPARFA